MSGVDVFPAPRTAVLHGGRRPVAEVQVVRDEGLAPQHYRLTIADTAITVHARDDAGVRYARDTLRQLTTAGTVPLASIEDGPDIAVRGVMLDVSRNKVPTMATLRGLLDRMSSWRLNHLMLYIEHTYAYEGFEDVWSGWSPFTAQEIRTLDTWCDDLGVELVIQQNCLGHMEHWLSHDRFADLAAIPGGWHDDRGHAEPPTTLDPRLDGSKQLVRELLRQQSLLRPHARRIHLGLDEPFDLNPEIWERIYAPETYSDSGVGEVFTVPLGPEGQQLWTSWLAWLRSLPEVAGQDVLAWADVVSANPDTAADIPVGVTLMEWGYEAYHPFEDRCAALASRDLPFWVCCGSSGWSSIAGRPTNARANIDAAATAGVAHGAGGIVVSDWGDRGHVQQLVISEPAFAWTAHKGWRSDAESSTESWDAVSTRYVFHDAAGELGRLVRRLGDAYRSLRPQVPEISVLLPILADPSEFSRLRDAGLSAAALAELSAELSDLGSAIGVCRPDRPDADLVLAELGHTVDWLQYATRLGRYRLAVLDGAAAAGQEQELVEEHARLLKEFSIRWLARNREGGLSDTLDRLSDTHPAAQVS